MLKRMIITLAIAALVVAGLGYVKFRQVKSMMAVYASYEPPPEAVTTLQAQEEQWPEQIEAIGTVTARRGVTVAADLAGVVEQIAFESGQTVKEGDVLVVLDTRQERAQLNAADAKQNLARTNLERIRRLVEERVASQAELDRAEAEFKEAEATVGEIRATIGRKTIRAPFSGVLGIRQINLGEYLAPGTPIVPLQALTPIYVNFAVPQQHVGLKPGTPVRVALQDDGYTQAGRVTAVDSVVDPATRNVNVQATFANKDARLRPGMFVQATVGIGASAPHITLPASAINHAPYGDSVFVVTNLTTPDGRSYQGVQQRFVTVGPARGDRVAVLSGIAAGDQVVTSGVFKLRNNAAVQINNSVQPSNELSPNVENRP